MALPLMTQVELVDDLADKTGASRSEVKTFLAALEVTIHENLASCVRTKVAGIFVAPALRAATKKRMGRNPQTGEEVPVAAKPASVRIALKADKNLKGQAPTTRKLSAAL